MTTASALVAPSFRLPLVLPKAKKDVSHDGLTLVRNEIRPAWLDGEMPGWYRAESGLQVPLCYDGVPGAEGLATWLDALSCLIYPGYIARMWGTVAEYGRVASLGFVCSHVSCHPGLYDGAPFAELLASGLQTRPFAFGPRTSARLARHFADYRDDVLTRVDATLEALRHAVPASGDAPALTWMADYDAFGRVFHHAARRGFALVTD